jgi:hypothetical protein
MARATSTPLCGQHAEAERQPDQHELTVLTAVIETEVPGG